MNFTVYCGANLGDKITYKEVSEQLGNYIGRNGDTLVYGAGNTGLMGTIADSVLKSGGDVIGIIPKFLVDLELVHEGITDVTIVDTMTERKQMMYEKADCFVALPGGLGTLEEISEVISWTKLGQSDRACIFFNVDGFYKNLQLFIKDMIKHEFLSEGDLSNIYFVGSMEEFIRIIEEEKWKNIK